MKLKRFKKKIEEYKPGDVIRAIINDKRIKKGNREHCFIIIEYPREKSDTKKHIVCVPACSFSSKQSKITDNKCLNLEGLDLPENFFGTKKPTSFLRFSEPTCLEKYLIKEYVDNLTSYPKIWKAICELMKENYSEEIGMLESACDCDCLDENNIEVSFCNQDEDFLLTINPEIRNHKNCLVCACCFEIIESEKGNINYILCGNCEDNLYVTYFDNESGIRVDIPQT